MTEIKYPKGFKTALELHEAALSAPLISSRPS